MTKKCKDLLHSLTKEETIEIIDEFLKSTGWHERYENMLVMQAEIYIQRKKQREEEAQCRKELDLFNEFGRASNEYQNYVFNIARKYGIIEKDRDGKDTFNWGKWFNKATAEEKQKALELETARKNAFLKWKEMEAKNG